MGPPDASRRFRLSMTFWPEAKVDPAQPLATEFAGAGGAGGAAAAALTLAAKLIALPIPATMPRTDSPHAAEARLALAEVAGSGVPWSLWRGKDGWFVVHTASHEAWRTFCGTFLNRTAWRSVAAADAWRDAEVNVLATTVLDTHPADDAVGTCLTYGVAAAAVAGWRDCETAGASRRLADTLAWAALIESGGTT